MLLLDHANLFYTFSMSLQEYYEDSYRMESGRGPGNFKEEAIASSKGLYHYVLESKSRFLAHCDWQGMRVLELGSGRGGLGLQLAQLGAHITLVDFSPTALEQGKALFTAEGHEVRTLTADVTHPDIGLGEKYDLIIDSHLLHCLIDDPDRASYYKLIYDHLKPKGICVAETMVHRKKLFIPEGFKFDEKYVLWQMFGQWTPVRRILDSLDLEQELNAANFNITYFYYYGSYSFVPHRSFMDIPSEILPAAVRMVLQNKED
jgi:SAM-dependent methyltransferase